MFKLVSRKTSPHACLASAAKDEAVESKVPAIQLKGLSFAEAQRALSPVQAKGATQAADHVHEAAQAGVRGGGGDLPHSAQIQASFGGHDVSGVSAHVGGQAAESCKSMGTTAFASGNNVAFSSGPSLHTAAHEAGSASSVQKKEAGAQVQMDQQWEGLLTSNQETAATRYNRSRGYRRTTVMTYQNAVRTKDDGAFGPNTAEAIACFQREHGLQVDGKLGPGTAQAIEAQINEIKEANAPLPGQTMGDPVVEQDSEGPIRCETGRLRDGRG